MDKDLLIRKLEFNIKEQHMTIPEALNLAYGAGCDERGRELAAHNKKKVAKFDRNGKQIGDTYESVAQAARKEKVGATGIYSAIERKSMTKKGYYWRYVNEITC